MNAVAFFDYWNWMQEKTQTDWAETSTNDIANGTRPSDNRDPLMNPYISASMHNEPLLSLFLLEEGECHAPMRGIQLHKFKFATSLLPSMKLLIYQV